jgi:hypothetical protein
VPFCKCGALPAPGMRFCAYCGSKIPRTESSPPLVGAAPVDEKLPSQESTAGKYGGQAPANSNRPAVELLRNKSGVAKYIGLLLGMVIAFCISEAGASLRGDLLPTPFGLAGFAIGAIIDQHRER